MEKSANYIILPELKLILECCKGQATPQDIILLKKIELLDKYYRHDYNVIVDFREFENFITSTTNKSILNLLNFLKEIGVKCKVALLTTKPHQVVVTEIIKRLSVDFSTFKFETFSTLEAAIKFVGFSIDCFELINNKLIELNENTV